jgi:DNA polymerase-3 subunit alpha
MNAVALTDHGKLYGAIEVYSECRDAWLKPIVGYEVFVAPSRRTERVARRGAGRHLTLLAKNRTGCRNLVNMASAAFLEGYHYVLRIDRELLAALSEGLSCLSGCASSEFSEAILRDQLDEATGLAHLRRRLLGKNFYFKGTVGTSSAAAPRPPSTSPTGSACRWWTRATPTI